MQKVKTVAQIEKIGIDEDLGIWIVSKIGKWIYINPENAKTIIENYMNVKEQKSSL